MAAGNVIQNFKIKVFLADLFQEFAGTPMESHFLEKNVAYSNG